MLVGVLARRETQKCGLQKSISSTWLREARLMSIPRKRGRTDDVHGE
jgi:hypothetical protein